MIKHLLTCAAAAVLAASSLSAQRPSPPAEESTSIGGKAVTIKYHSPFVKGRKIFGPGGLIAGDRNYPIWRAGANPATLLHTELDLKIGDLDVPAGDFTADLFSMRGTYSFSTRMSTNVLVQYNSLDRDFSTNVRFNFVHRPGSDFFIVFTENRGDGERVWNLSDRGLVMKVTYLARL